MNAPNNPPKSYPKRMVNQSEKFELKRVGPTKEIKFKHPPLIIPKTPMPTKYTLAIATPWIYLGASISVYTVI